MTLGKKMKICLLSGLIAAFAGSILVFALSEAVRMFAVAGLIMAAVAVGRFHDSVVGIFKVYRVADKRYRIIANIA